MRGGARTQVAGGFASGVRPGNRGPELYATRIRSRAIGFTWSRFSTIFVGFMVAFFLRNYGTVGVFAFIALAMIACCLIIGTLGPATTRLRLEQISR